MEVFVSNIFIPTTREACKRGKDCCDFIPLKDGTKTGDPKYCDRSLYCRQIDMKSDWHQFIDVATGELKFDYFCIGVYAKKEDIGEDKEVS
jgi:hypothetical protein